MPTSNLPTLSLRCGWMLLDTVTGIPFRRLGVQMVSVICTTNLRDRSVTVTSRCLHPEAVDCQTVQVHGRSR